MAPHADEPDATALPAELQATTDRLRRRMRRLGGRANELQQSAERLRASTQRLRARLQSSFPPPPLDPEPEAKAAADLEGAATPKD